MARDLSRKKQILILGSAPSAQIIKNDVTFAANASAGYFKKDLELAGSNNIFTVVSASELDYSGREISREKLEWLDERKRLIRDSLSAELVVYGVNVFKNAIAEISSGNDNDWIEGVSFSEYWRVVEKVTGRTCPILTWGHFFGAKTRFDLVLKIYLRSLVDRFFVKDAMLSALFMPSTGMFCLLLAIYRYGTTARYTVSGISFRSRGIYPDNTLNSWSGKDRLMDYHIIVDRDIMKKLRRQYDITILD
jgi:hypothetical protein